MSETEIEAAHNIVRVNKIVTVEYLLRTGHLHDAHPETIQLLVASGCIVRPVIAKRTAGSRQLALTVPALARSTKIARRPDYMLVQLLGLHAAKVLLGLPPLDQCWVPIAEYNSQFQAGRFQFVSGTCPDGRWDEYGRDGLMASWQLEYSHGEFEARRLREKIVALGPNPQIWVTPSASHGRMIEKLLHEIYPLLTRKRVIVVDWTQGAA